MIPEPHCGLSVAAWQRAICSFITCSSPCISHAKSLTMNAPVLQPRAAADPYLDGRDWFQSIPVEMTRKIVPFCDMPSLVLFAATSTSNRRFVFQECPFLWTTIDFGKINQRQAARLTDECLNSLLSNVNARRNTTSLSLMRCTSVQGTGLAPLMFSRHLEQIELRKSRNEIETFGETGLNDAFVVAVLSTMAPMNESLARQGGSSGLKIVKIRKQHDSPTFVESFAEPIRDFLFDWIAANSSQVKEQQVVCKDCSGALVDRIPEQNFAWKASTCFCNKCKSFFCGEGRCENSIGCDMCMDQFCGHCAFVACCDLCTNFFCDDCRPTGFCDSEQCRGCYCVECRETAICDICDPTKSWCSECRSVTMCDSCMTNICIECGVVKQCIQCGCDCCAECDPMEYCTSCYHCHCRKCGDVHCRFQTKKKTKRSGSDVNGSERPSKRSRAV